MIAIEYVVIVIEYVVVAIEYVVVAIEYVHSLSMRDRTPCVIQNV